MGCVGTQTDLTREHVLLFLQELQQVQLRISELESRLRCSLQLFTAKSTLNNDRFVQFYTGLPNAALLKASL